MLYSGAIIIWPGEISGHQCCKSYFYIFFVSEIPSHDFCCAYLERQNMIFVYWCIIHYPFL